LESIANQIFNLFIQYGYLAIFVGVMLDNAGFPIPGELILLLTGSLVASGHFAFVPAAMAAAVGALISDSAWYFAGRKGSRNIIQFYCKMSFGSAACLAKTEHHLTRFGPKSLIYARFIPGYRTFAAPMAGMSGVTYRQFVLYDGIGAFLWAGLGVGIGSMFASKVMSIIGVLENSKVVLLYVAGSLLLLFLLVKWIVRRRHGAALLPSPEVMAEASATRLSIIIPTLNEAGHIEASLAMLQPLRAAGHVIIIVDGGSDDDTAVLAKPLADHIILSERGRSQQMNAGARLASGDVLLFLHADTQLPDVAMHLISGGLARSGKSWGRFNVRLSGRQALLRVVERMMNLRSCLTGIATGDQAIFVRREAFFSVEGFANIPLMEDIALSRTLKNTFGRPLCIVLPVITSSRRWEQNGIMRTILLMWQLRMAYFFGTSPQELADRYYPKKSEN
jgi:rSAM/selenodomain-associated transferase 2